MNNEADVTYHGMGVMSFVTINEEHLMRLQTEDGIVSWYHATEDGFVGDIKKEAALPFELAFKDNVDMQLQIRQQAPLDSGDERPEGSYLQ